MTNRTEAGPPDEAGLRELSERLAEPFSVDEIKWKPQVVKGERAMVVAYVDARVVMDRLDAVFGSSGWSDEYSLLDGGCVLCRLSCRVNGEWIHKADVGSPSEQPDEGDRIKAAHSDALKRAAIKWGIGRYLYRLPTGVWVDYDSKARTFRPPALPDWALPRGDKSAARRPAPPARPVAKTRPAPAPAPTPAPAPAAPKSNLPADGRELLARLTAYDAAKSAEGIWPKGALLVHVAQAGEKAGFGTDLLAWTDKAIELAVAETKAFEAASRAKAAG